MVHQFNAAKGRWETKYSANPHSQPILSLDLSLNLSSSEDSIFFTSSADAIIAKHPIPSPNLIMSSNTTLKTVSTGHAGQQSLVVRSDRKAFATAGWDSRIRVYSVKTMKEVAVLKWHREGCYAVAFGFIKENIVQTTVGGPATDSTAIRLTQDASSDVIKTIDQQRNERTQNTHWLAAGSKDGRISLWEVF